MKENKILFIVILLLSKPLFGQQIIPNWVEETTHADWLERDSQAEVVFNDQLWIMGGWFNSYEAPPRDVWSSKDGKEWQQVQKTAPWIHSDLAMSVVFKNKIWMMGGWYNGRLEGHSASRQVWSTTNGSQWELETDQASWTPRLAAAVVVFKRIIRIVNGTEKYYFGDESRLKTDDWYSADRRNWRMATADAGWSPRAYHQAAVLNGKIYVIGGGNYVPEHLV